MQPVNKRAPFLIVAFLSALALFVSSGAALAASADPIGDTTESVTDEVTKAKEEANKTKAEVSKPAPTASGSTDPAQGSGESEHVEESNAAASSSGSVIDLQVLDEEVLVVSGASSAAGQAQQGEEEEKSSSADAVLLRVLGQELWGAHASSEEGEDSRSGLLIEITDQICSGSGGFVCIGLLFLQSTTGDEGNSERNSVATVCVGGSQEEVGHECDGPVAASVGYAGAHASEDADGTNSSSDTHVADVCVGSEEGHSSGETCDGPVGARVAEAHSESSSSDSEAQTHAENSTAEVCVGGENEEGICDGVGIVLLHSESGSSATTAGDSSSESRAQIVAVEAQGEEQVSIDDSANVSLPPGCTEPSLVCLDLNQTASEAEAGAAAGAAEAIGAEVGGGITGEGETLLDGSVNAAQSSADMGQEDEVQTERRRRPTVQSPPQVQEAPPTSRLPVTGAGMVPFLALGLMLTVVGNALRMRGRRERLW